MGEVREHVRGPKGERGRCSLTGRALAMEMPVSGVNARVGCNSAQGVMSGAGRCVRHAGGEDMLAHTINAHLL